MVQLGKSYYNSILSATFSPCGEYFVAGNVFGDIRLFNFQNLLCNTEEISDNDTKISKNRFNFNTSFEKPISYLSSSDKFCIAGIDGEILGWPWTDVIGLENGNTIPAPSWKIRLPQSGENSSMKTDLNCIKIETGVDCVLYVGCSNNNIYAFSLEDGRLLRTYSGHTDFVHCLNIRENTLISGGEDGTIRMWDCRSKEIINVVKPYTNSSVTRPELGNWIGDASLNEDWMVCGGGVRLSLWNLRNMDSPMTVFNNTKDRGIHIAQFYQDRILAGGCSSCFSVLSYNDELHTGIETSSNPVYSCNISTPKDTNKILCLTGSSNKIDISTNFNYREFVIPFY
ncbi:THO complex subunit 6 homolog [Planococcus citri]|uniref:THO complex subunit 6 homolog n=1 Tax=Planococcus citri TaxID=170843 RepID=UPI0031F9BF33